MKIVLNLDIQSRRRFDNAEVETKVLIRKNYTLPKEKDKVIQEIEKYLKLLKK